MFENIDNRDWRGFRLAGDNAGQVPEALKSLTDEDPSVRESSYWKLDNYVIVQSDLYEAAFHVIPFLLELIDTKDALGRDHAVRGGLSFLNRSLVDRLLPSRHG